MTPLWIYNKTSKLAAVAVAAEGIEDLNTNTAVEYRMLDSCEFKATTIPETEKLMAHLRTELWDADLGKLLGETSKSTINKLDSLVRPGGRKWRAAFRLLLPHAGHPAGTRLEAIGVPAYEHEGSEVEMASPNKRRAAQTPRSNKRQAAESVAVLGGNEEQVSKPRTYTTQTWSATPDVELELIDAFRSMGALRELYRAFGRPK